MGRQIFNLTLFPFSKFREKNFLEVNSVNVRFDPASSNKCPLLAQSGHSKASTASSIFSATRYTDMNPSV
jgi:hypothetical protein